jgi:hypothetical protein
MHISPPRHVGAAKIDVAKAALARLPRDDVDDPRDVFLYAEGRVRPPMSASARPRPREAPMMRAMGVGEAGMLVSSCE